MCTTQPTHFNTWNNLTYIVLATLEAFQGIYRVPPPGIYG